MSLCGQARKILLEHLSSRNRKKAYKIPMLVVPSHNSSPKRTFAFAKREKEIKIFSMGFSPKIWKVTNFVVRSADH